jgi:hypothetical protein
MLRETILVIFLGFLIHSLSIAQDHDHHSDHHHDTLEHNMSHRFSLSLPMTRNGSGTGWLPDSSPMYGKMFHKRGWMMMLHGNIFLRYNNQDAFRAGERGASKFDAPNWIMGMAQKKLGKRHLLSFSTMLSLDPVTVGGEGYPLLFQTGETWQGRALVDRQHPHNFFSELSVGYSYQLSEKTDFFLYLAYPGEPALGPVAFMHRVSALSNPDSPLGHHWQDATHIAFGVATLGIRHGIFKLDVSKFTGAEPSENRWGFDPPLMDSWAGRVAANPHKNLSLQLSHSYLVSPEATQPGVDVRRTTASILHQSRFSNEENYLSSALFWGLNQSDHNEHSIGYEFTWRTGNNYVYGRYEWIQKDADELQIDLTNNHQNDHHHLVNINALTLGYSRIIFRAMGIRCSAGLQGTVFLADDLATPEYGRTPVSFQVYTRIFPGLMR